MIFDEECCSALLTSLQELFLYNIDISILGLLYGLFILFALYLFCVQKFKLFKLNKQDQTPSDYVITARIRRMGEGNIFTLCVSPRLDFGGGEPRSGLDGWGEGVVPQPGLDSGGGGGTPPGQVWMVGAYPPPTH